MKGAWHYMRVPANFAAMSDQPPSDPAPPESATLVDTTPAGAEGVRVTYAILFVVLAALVAFFIIRVLRR